MTYPTPMQFRIRSLLAAVPALLLPSIARAGWGEENWGEMVWSFDITQVPSMSVGGLIALALALVSGASIVRRRRERS